MNFDIIQTFYVDSTAVFNSSTIQLSSIELFFRNKPSKEKNTSGYPDPGVSVFICPVENGTPDPSNKLSTVVRLPYDEIFAFSDASSPSVFKFPSPALLKTNKSYGVVITLEDAQYELWQNKQNDFILGTNTRSSGSNQVNEGKYYEASSTEGIKSLNDRTLKYKINIAKFQANTITQIFTNKNYEFMDLQNVNGRFSGGEFVYKVSANNTGSVSVTAGTTLVKGTGTSFTSILEDSYIVVKSGVEEEVLKLDTIIDDTTAYAEFPSRLSNTAANWSTVAVGKNVSYSPEYEYIALKESSSNTSLKFSPGDTVRGELSKATGVVQEVKEMLVNKFYPEMKITTSSKIDTDISYSLTKLANGVFSSTPYSPLLLDRENLIEEFNTQLLSASEEVDTTTLNNNKSINVKIDFNVKENSDQIFSAPRIDINDMNVFIGDAIISQSTHVNGLDTEVTRNGTSKCRYVSNKVSFANNHYAEDVRVFIDAYKPADTVIQVYAKIHNSADQDSFDDKDWTPLQCIENADRVSGSRSDLVEYTYGFPMFQEVDTSLGGTFTTSLGSNVITANDITPNTYLAVGDAIRIYSPLFPENQFVGIVQAVTTTTVTINSPIDSSNVAGAGFKIQKLKYPHSAFLNTNNDNVVRYYNSQNSIYDTYNSMQIKIVLLSTEKNIVPEVDSLQVVGVSA